MLNPFQIYIHVEFRPVAVVAMREFDGEQLLERRATKPGEISEREKLFPLAHELPEFRLTVRRNHMDVHPRCFTGEEIKPV